MITATVRSERGRHDVTLATGGNSRTLDIPPRAPGFGSAANGGELLCLALATCYCNDVYREAERRSIEVLGVEVQADARFDAEALPASRLSYRVTVRAAAPEHEIRELILHTDRVAEVHNTLRLGMPVTLESYSAVTVEKEPAARAALWLVLEDNPKRASAFEKVAAGLGFEIRIWRAAPAMIRELPGLLKDAALVSLDHDLYKQHESDPDPGCGREVAGFLSRQKSCCPVIIHSTNTDAAWGMHNELRSAGWAVEIIHHLDEPDWIEQRWRALARSLTGDRPAEFAGPVSGKPGEPAAGRPPS